MNWEAIGSIGELLGAMGVIASLLYLAAQIRQGANASLLATSLSNATAARQWSDPMLADPDLARIFLLGTEDIDSLDERDRARFVVLCFSFFRMFEDIHFQFENGALDAGLWEGYKTHYGAYCKSPGFQHYWKLRRDAFRPAFREFIDSLPPPSIVRMDAIVAPDQ